MLPKFFLPFPDELLSSWIFRLSRENVVSIERMYERYFGRSASTSRKGYVPFDIKNGLYELQSHLIYQPNLKELFLNATTFQFEALFMGEKLQARHVNYMFRPSDKFVTPVDAFFKEVKVCRDCVQEDGQGAGAYFHCSHQLSGVVTCHKHGTRLLHYKGSIPDACQFDLTEYTECQPYASIESLQAYTQYAETLFRGNINSNVDKVKELILQRLGSQNLEDMVQGWKYKDLFRYDVETIQQKFENDAALSSEICMPLLMLLIPDPVECCKTLKDDNEIILQRICPVCGMTYYTTAFTESVGYGCPRCESKLPDQKRYENYVKKVSNNDYVVTGSFVSIGKKLEHRHEICGRTINLSPDTFLFKGVRCICERTLTEENAKLTIDSYEGFHLIEYHTGKRRIIKVHHDGCGMDFECQYDKFIKTPLCRCCQLPLTTPFEQKIKNIAGNDYSLVSKYIDQKHRVQIRHNVCGNIQSYAPSDFLGGQRCSLCNDRLRDNWMNWYECLKRYENETGSANPPINEIFEEKKIGVWCSRQRAAWAVGKLSDIRKDLLDSLSFDWAPAETAWNKKYELYKEFMQTGAKECYSTTYNGVCIGEWAHKQRIDYQNGVLSPEKVEKLNEIGFDWFRNTPGEVKAYKDWEDAFELYREYKSKHGYVLRSTKYQDFNLGDWVHRQRVQMQNGTLLPERKALLDSVGFDWDARQILNEEWKKKCEIYIEATQELGELTLTTIYKDEKVGEWIHLQRKQYRNGTLYPERKEYLESIGFDWGVKEKLQSDWEQKAALYVECKEKLGVVTLTTEYKDVKIGNWVHSQRKQYKKGTMPPERKMYLDAIGFEWDDSGQLQAEWEKKCALYAECLEELGSVVQNTKYKGVSIGNWMFDQRKAYKRGTLSQEREEMLKKVNPLVFE